MAQDRVPIATDITRAHRVKTSQIGANARQYNVESFSKKMAQRLTMKTVGHLVSYVSYNVLPTDHLQLQMFCEMQVLLKLREIGLLAPPPQQQQQ